MMQRPEYPTTYGDQIGEWLSDQPWSHFATITAPYPLTLTSARRLAQRTIDRWKSITSADAKMVYAIERNTDGMGHHIHALVHFTAEVDPDMFARMVDGQGRIDLQRYDPKQAGARYITKAVTERRDNWDTIH